MKDLLQTTYSKIFQKYYLIEKKTTLFKLTRQTMLYNLNFRPMSLPPSEICELINGIPRTPLTEKNLDNKPCHSSRFINSESSHNKSIN